MNSRLLASLAVGVAVVLGTAGCSMISPQATTIAYSASDGVNVPDSGPLEVRNALIIANESGTAGNLIAGIVNSSDERQTLRVTLGDGRTQMVPVPARGVVSLGIDADPLLFLRSDTVPGTTVDVAFQSGDATGVLLPVPVLDGTLPYYTDYVPTPAEIDG